ncbi:hypothetical protein PGTUg99_036269 [Puccinia graminis f. sp. tritici]|uniref:Uncharacterized protein n=1 Tax=Puccinia graminis f. sp. tritici TaxID=56615 RepID=A0A5B0SMJ3_PUCGR|nr:hypothetical protein PGTUg99_036269 [Puccinia graminis f. sp. tritici]
MALKIPVGPRPGSYRDSLRLNPDGHRSRFKPWPMALKIPVGPRPGSYRDSLRLNPDGHRPRFKPWPMALKIPVGPRPGSYRDMTIDSRGRGKRAPPPREATSFHLPAPPSLPTIPIPNHDLGLRSTELLNTTTPTNRIGSGRVGSDRIGSGRIGE